MSIDDTMPPVAFDRLGKIKTCRELRAEGCSEVAAQRASDSSRTEFGSLNIVEMTVKEAVRALAER